MVDEATATYRAEATRESAARQASEARLGAEVHRLTSELTAAREEAREAAVRANLVTDARDFMVLDAVVHLAALSSPAVCERNPEEAATMFKLVAEAYEALSDPDTRALYDRYGHAGLERGLEVALVSGLLRVQEIPGGCAEEPTREKRAHEDRGFALPSAPRVRRRSVVPERTTAPLLSFRLARSGRWRVGHRSKTDFSFIDLSSFDWCS